MVSISEAEEQQEPDTGSAPATIFNEASASANDDKMNEDNHHPQNEDTMDKSGGQNHDQDSSAIQQETKDTDMVDSSLEENVGKGMDHPMKGEGEPSSAQQENEGAITQETEQKVENGHLEEKQDVTTEDASSPDSGWVFVNGTNPKSSSPREKSILEAPARINGSKTSLAKSLVNSLNLTTEIDLSNSSHATTVAESLASISFIAKFHFDILTSMLVWIIPSLVTLLANFIIFKKIPGPHIVM